MEKSVNIKVSDYINKSFLENFLIDIKDQEELNIIIWLQHYFIETLQERYNAIYLSKYGDVKPVDFYIKGQFGNIIAITNEGEKEDMGISIGALYFVIDLVLFAMRNSAVDLCSFMNVAKQLLKEMIENKEVMKVYLLGCIPYTQEFDYEVKKKNVRKEEIVHYICDKVSGNLLRIETINRGE